MGRGGGGQHEQGVHTYISVRQSVRHASSLIKFTRSALQTEPATTSKFPIHTHASAHIYAMDMMAGMLADRLR